MTKAQLEIEVQTHIANQNWPALVQLCEVIEFESSNEPPSPNAGTFYGIQLFAYLIVNDLNSARFLWKRIPTEIKAANPELANIWKIGQHVWKREYQPLYTIATAAWSLIYQPLATAFLSTFRSRSFALLSRAYSSINAIDCGYILGYSPEEVVKLVTAQGWAFDPVTKLIEPKPRQEPVVQKTGLDELHSLTKYVVFLETK
jgi:COP9 signalosome complex subunit 8